MDARLLMAYLVEKVRPCSESKSSFRENYFIVVSEFLELSAVVRFDACDCLNSAAVVTFSSS